MGYPIILTSKRLPQWNTGFVTSPLLFIKAYQLKQRVSSNKQLGQLFNQIILSIPSLLEKQMCYFFAKCITCSPLFLVMEYMNKSKNGFLFFSGMLFLDNLWSLVGLLVGFGMKLWPSVGQLVVHDEIGWYPRKRWD